MIGSKGTASTDGNVTVNGFVTSVAGESTLTAADKIDGNGGINTLNITVAGTATATDNGADIQNIDIVNIRNVGTGAAALNADNIPGASQVWSDRSTGNFTVTNLATDATVGMRGNGVVNNGNINFAYKTATDPVSVAIDGGTKAGNIVNDGTGATTANIMSTGAANKIGTLTLDGGANIATANFNASSNLEVTTLTDTAFAANSTINLMGTAESVKISNALANNVKTVDASGMTADFSAKSIV